LYSKVDNITSVVGFVVPYKITWYGLQLFHSGAPIYSVAFVVSYAFWKTVTDDRMKKKKIFH
jgi:hypothetical protein